ncbi:MAG: selenocysteine-specific translation elongation factor [Gemmatimonadetes bacterium]|nr:selenocysteine-specific translation elongation factor [Gemmatimonadota bacterium]
MIIGTAGHIDHGKTTLIEALTGRRLDPLAEERRRGITLDLHFAHLGLGDGRVVGVVDVPGHEDLVRTMVAGAGGLDLVLLVIAADDGIMPQTREHRAIVEQLRVPAGIPVITRADLVEPDWLALVEAEVGEWLAGSPVRFAPPVVTAAPAGRGIAELRAAISAALPSARRPVADLFRLPVDRAFSVAGAGTVLTGTAWSGTVALGDAVRLFPGGAEGRVRSLERHGTAQDRSTPGERTALAVAGLERRAVRRGEVLVRAGDPWRVTTAIDAEVELLPAASRSLTASARVRVHLGTAEVLARVQPREAIAPGRAGLVRLALEAPLVARGGDRLVPRSYSPVATIGGGLVVDPLPPRGKPHWPDGLTAPEPILRLSALLARRRDGVVADELAQLLGVAPAVAARIRTAPAFLEVAGRLFPREAVEAQTKSLLAAVRDHHRHHPAAPGISLQTLRAGRGPLAGVVVEQLVQAGQLVVEEGWAREPGFTPRVAGGDVLLDRIVATITEAGLAPPSVAELEARLGVRGVAEACRLATRNGRLVAVERDRFYAPATLEQLRAVLVSLTAAGPFAPPAVRERLGISRKFLIPLLEWADQAGLTVRRGDARVAGPALTGAAPGK